MKKFKILSVLMVLGLTASAQTISIDEVTVRVKEKKNVSIKLAGGSGYVASGFSVELPEGIVMTGDATNDIGSHIMKSNLKNDRAMKIAMYSSQNQSFSNTTTGLLSLEVTPNCKPGTYQGKISGIEFATNSYGLKKMSDVTFTIIVKNMYGDVNSDNKVTITDAVGIVNNILGNPSSNFDKDAANINGDIDDNGDPKITITDAVGVVNIILNNGGSVSAPQMDAPQEPETMMEPE